ARSQALARARHRHGWEEQGERSMVDRSEEVARAGGMVGARGERSTVEWSGRAAAMGAGHSTVVRSTPRVRRGALHGGPVDIVSEARSVSTVDKRSGAARHGGAVGENSASVSDTRGTPRWSVYRRVSMRSGIAKARPDCSGRLILR